MTNYPVFKGQLATVTACAPARKYDPRCNDAALGATMNDSASNTAGKILTEHETAAYLKVKIFSLRKWRREGGGPPYIRCGGRIIRYVEADIANWLFEKTFRSQAHELQNHVTQ